VVQRDLARDEHPVAINFLNHVVGLAAPTDDHIGGVPDARDQEVHPHGAEVLAALGIRLDHHVGDVVLVGLSDLVAVPQLPRGGGELGRARRSVVPLDAAVRRETGLDGLVVAVVQPHVEPLIEIADHHAIFHGHLAHDLSPFLNDGIFSLTVG